MAPADGDSGDSTVVVHSIKKRDNEEIRLSLSKYSGTEFIDIRSHYLNQDSGEFRPSRRGVTLRYADYPELLSGVIELGRVLGLLESDPTPGKENIPSNTPPSKI